MFGVEPCSLVMVSSATRFIVLPSHLDSGVDVLRLEMKSCADDHVDERNRFVV